MPKNKIIVSLIIPAVILGSGGLALACSTCGEPTPTGVVNAITLSGTGAEVSWVVDSYSAKGFKVVWSKNTGPIYPTRSDDKYHYYSDPSRSSDILTAFAGEGTYYVRVCEYLGSACGTYSNEISVYLKAKTAEPIACAMDYNPVCGVDGKTYSNKCVLTSMGVAKAYYGECKKDEEIIKIEQKAEQLNNNQLDTILAELQELRNLVRKQQSQIQHLQKLLLGVAAVTEKMQKSINNFITYGVDENTKKLGEGERAAVMYSFKSAFGKLPENDSELADAIKIANGRWPSLTSEEAENKAKIKFERIYLRTPDMDDPHDNAAITIMAYGLRQKAGNRNLDSERHGLKIFRGIFYKLPQSTEEWNALQAITYSGSKR